MACRVPSDPKPHVRSLAVAIRPEDGRMCRRPFLVSTLAEAAQLKADGFWIIGPDPDDGREYLAWGDRHRNNDDGA